MHIPLRLPCFAYDCDAALDDTWHGLRPDTAENTQKIYILWQQGLWALTDQRAHCRAGSRIRGQLTFRSLAVGLAVGTLLCFSNTYFGLQTGWVTMGSLQVVAWQLNLEVPAVEMLCSKQFIHLGVRCDDCDSLACKHVQVANAADPGL